MAGLGLNNLRFDNKGFLPNTVSTMKRTTPTEGATGQLAPLMGAAALGPAAPLVAPILNPVVGSGLGGALATIGLTPTNSEASLLSDIGKLSKSGLRNKSKNAWNMGGREMFELSTNSAGKKTSAYHPDFLNGSYKYKGLDDTLSHNVNSLQKNYNLSPSQAEKVNSSLDGARKYTATVEDGFENTYLMQNPKIQGYAKESDKTIAVRGAPSSGKNDVNNFKGFIDHEFQHGLQDSPFSPMKYLKKTIPSSNKDFDGYLNALPEIEARVAGGRANYGRTLTNPDSKYGVHPLLDWSKNNRMFDTKHASNYLDGMVKSGMMTKEEAGNFMGELVGEQVRLSNLARTKSKFENLLNGRHIDSQGNTDAGENILNYGINQYKKTKIK